MADQTIQKGIDWADVHKGGLQSYKDEPAPAPQSEDSSNESSNDDAQPEDN
jgi:hypothetical protein